MSYLPKAIALAVIIAAPSIQAQTCNLSEYKASPGLTADAAQKTVTITWEGERTKKSGCALPCRTERRQSRISLSGTKEGHG